MSTLDLILQQQLNSLHQRSLLRRLRRIDDLSGSKAKIDGRWVVSFGSNDYLGIASRPALFAQEIKPLYQQGQGSTGSRLTSGNFGAHQQLEAEIAVLKHTESTILFSSGYAANIGTIPALVERGDLILSDQLNHASLIDGCRLSNAEIRVYRHSDHEHARSLLADRSSFRNVLIATDGVFSMDGDLAPLKELVKLKTDFASWLLVDDAHGTGVLGTDGSGIIEHQGLIGQVEIQMGTLSKAVGTAGGFVAGSAILIEWLRNRARSFMFSTAAAPTEIQSTLRSLSLIKSRPDLRQDLHNNICRMKTGLVLAGVQIAPGESPIIPIIIGSSQKAVSLSSRLENKGLWIPAIRPPTVAADSARLRITVTAAHTTDDIDTAVAAIASELSNLDGRSSVC